MPRKAIFLDRDGVINVDKGYVCKPEDVEFTDGVFDFCRNAHKHGFLLIVVTNQSGIGRGLYSEDDFQSLMRWMWQRFQDEGCPLTAYYFCPHHPEHGKGVYKQNCECRKPKPGMLLQAIKEWDIDPAESMLVGDKESDLEAGRAAGIGTVKLYSGG